jgi:homogentisate 1,2-dioxygenase
MRIAETLAFMFETRFAQHLTRFAAELATLQVDYAECWKGLARNFTGAR